MDDPVEDLAARLAWRKSLNEYIVRELAYEYLRGDRSQCNKDAYDEFLLRFPREAAKKRVRAGRPNGILNRRRA